MATIGTAIRLNDMMSAPLRHITNAMDGMLSAWNSLESSTKGGLDVGNMEHVRAEIKLASKGLDEMEEQQRKLNKHIQDGSNAMDGFADKIMGAVAAYASFQGMKQLVNLSDTYTQTQARLSMIVDEQSNVEELNNKIFASAQRARAPYQDMADTVAKLSLNAGDAFSSNDETILFAENLNKLFAIAGTDQSSIASASLQLTQALGSGVLRGEEFNAVFEAAPNIMQTVADYMDVPIGKLRSMAQDGQITAEIVKNALLSATGDINKQFESMPMTWGQVWTSAMNNLQRAVEPVLQAINWMANNWSILEPIVIGIAAAVGAYTAALLIHKGVAAASAFIESVRAARIAMTTVAEGAQTTATFAATAAQYGFNAALMACPLTWILIIIIAVIAAIYAIVAAINKVKGTTLSATGIIMGALATAGAFIVNLVIGVLNGIIQMIWTIFVEPFIGIIEWILNVCQGGFDSFGGAVANLIGNIIGWFLSLGKVVTKIIDAIFGTNWTAGLTSLQDKVTAWGKTENAITLDRSAPTIDYRMEYGNAWDKGYAFGEGIEDSVGGLFGGGNEEDYSLEQLTESVGDVPEIGDIANNTKDTANALDITNEDLKYLRDLAEQEAINRFTTAEIRVEMGGVNNTVNNNLDLDGVMDYMVTGVQEAMERVAEGVHS